MIEYERFIVLALYVPNSGQGLRRLSYRTQIWDPHLRDFVAKTERTSGKPVIVTGDLNVAHRDVDVYNYFASHLKKQPGCTEEERASFSKWLTDFDRRDALRAVHGDAKGQYTYWSSRAGNRPGNKGLRLDYFVVPNELIADSASTRTDASEIKVGDTWVIAGGFGGSNTQAAKTPSDHCPVACVLTRGE